jgi:hypothetical protein
MKRHLLAALAVLAAAGCSEDGSDPTSADLAVSLLPCVFGKGQQLQVGEALTVQGAEASTLCVEGAGDGSEYALVPFLASNGDARVRVTAVGGNLQDVTGPPNPSLAGDGALAREGGPVRDDRLHVELMERFRRDLGPRLRPTSAGGRSSLAPARSPATDEGVVPAVGDSITIAIPQFYRPVDPCEVSVTRRAKVSAVTQRAIVVNDPANPAGGLTDAELRAFGEEFDRVIYPTDVRFFGEPTDIDQNGRVIIVFSREVNALTPPNNPGYVGGFFFPGDLFPRVGTPRLDACPRSNVGEIFYLLAADPTGSVNNNPRSRALILQSAAGTIAHELEHLINSSRRIYVNNANQFEDSWLDEGLAHIAEELLFYEESGLTPRQNIDLARLGSSARVSNATDKYMLENFGRFLTYLESPDTNSLLGPDELETRGAAWAFLRYAADRKNTGDQPFFFNLVNTTTAGITNASRVIGANSLDWMQDWTLSVYTDDAVAGIDPRFTQPSWNFRSIMPRVSVIYGGPNVFPLEVHRLSSGGEQEYNLRGGGATYLRFGIASGARVALRLSSGDNLPPESLRFSLVRTR